MPPAHGIIVRRLVPSLFQQYRPIASFRGNAELVAFRGTATVGEEPLSSCSKRGPALPLNQGSKPLHRVGPCDFRPARAHPSEFRPGIGSTHIDDTDGFYARSGWLDTEEAWGLAALHTAPELLLSGQQKVLVEAIGRDGYGTANTRSANGVHPPPRNQSRSSSALTEAIRLPCKDHKNPR